MTRNLVRLAALNLSIILWIGTVAWSQPAHPAQSCSNASLTGRYGFLINGSSNGAPIAAMGQIATDGSGHISGIESFSENGTISANLSVLGSYSVKANCTGTMIIQAQGRSKQNFDVTVFSAGKQIDMVETDSGTTELGTAHAQLSKSCVAVGPKGLYGLLGTGAEVGVGPLALAGKVVLHGNGTLDGIETTSENGSVTSGQKIGGGIKILPRCIGAASIEIGNSGPIHLNLVVVDGGAQVLFIEVDDQTLISGSLER